MRLLSLSLESFRNYSSLSLSLGDADRQFLIGPNGSGKTNLLEAIALLSCGRSCRGAALPMLPSFGSSSFRVVGEFVGEHARQLRAEVTAECQPRRCSAYFQNDVRVPFGKFIGRIPVALFLPEDLSLFRGAPQLRRRFLDRILTQVSPSYLPHLLHYQRVLRQRNALLRSQSIPPPSEFLPWEVELARHGSAITLARLEFLETLHCTLLQELRTLGLPWSDAALSFVRHGVGRDARALEEEYVRMLCESRQRDTLLGSTTVGPHREDWQVHIAGRELSTFASRGEQRLSFLALLFLTVSYLELRRGEKPIVLLDDVFSELDDAHRSTLLSTLVGGQLFVTTTRVPPEHGGVLLAVSDGRIVLEGDAVHCA